MNQTPTELAISKGENIYLHGDQGVTEKIKRAMYDVAKQFVYIGFLLWEVKEYDYYSQSGYKDVYDYAERELGFKRTSTKNFISITEVFGSQQSMHELEDSVFRKQGEYRPSMNIQQEYRNFKYSQLCEMLSMSDKQREQVTPDMTVKEIRSLKQSIPPQEATSDSADPSQTSDQEINFKTLDKVITITKSQTSDQEHNLYLTNKEICYLIDLIDFELYEAPGDDPDNKTRNSILEKIVPLAPNHNRYTDEERDKDYSGFMSEPDPFEICQYCEYYCDNGTCDTGDKKKKKVKAEDKACYNFCPNSIIKSLPHD